MSGGPSFNTEGSVPVPDPTKLTTDAVTAASDQWRRDLQFVREILELRIKGVEEVSAERFVAIAQQFTERDTRAVQTAEEGQRSLSAALSAAKEAVKEQNTASGLAIGKSEETTKERLDGQGLLLATAVKSLEDKIRAVESRLDRGEAGGVAVKEAQVIQHASTGQILAVVGAVFTGLLLLVGVTTLIISLTRS